MDFDLASVSHPGRQPARLEFEIVREITEQDLFLLENGPARTSNVASIKSLSARHHKLARMIGVGVGPGEAGVICGYQGPTVSTLLANDAFKELVDFYRSAEEKALMSTFDKLGVLAESAMSVLQDRIEDAPDDLSTGELIKIGELALDRSGHGPSQTVQSINVSLSSRLTEARERAKRALLPAPTTEIIDAEVIPPDV